MRWIIPFVPVRSAARILRPVTSESRSDEMIRVEAGILEIGNPHDNGKYVEFPAMT